MSRKEKIIKALGDALGSCEKIAQVLAAESQFDISYSGQSVRRWFQDQDIPLRPLLVMLSAAGMQPTNAFVFHPYLKEFFQVKQ
jgi:hypothetical protein